MPKCTKIPLAVLLRPDPLEELMRSQTLYLQGGGGYFNNHKIFHSHHSQCYFNYGGLVYSIMQLYDSKNIHRNFPMRIRVILTPSHYHSKVGVLFRLP